MTKTAVYRFYDASGRLLYVGITANTTARWGRHKAKAAWWADRQRVEVTWHDDRVAAATEEYRAIRSENPIWNRAHTKAAGRTPYEPSSEVIAARIENTVALFREKARVRAEFKERLTELADEGQVPIAHLAAQLGLERKTVYRHLGRSMT